MTTKPKALLAVTVAVVLSFGMGAVPARANPAAFVAFLGYVKQGYDLFDKYLANHQPSDLSQLQATIGQAKAQIIAELDGLASAWDSSCAANAVDTFQSLDQLTPDNLQAFAISSDKCVTDAQARIDAVTDGAALDKIGFALNTVAPIALLVKAAAGFETSSLRQHVIDANRKLRTKLTPFCAVTIDNPAALPSFGTGPITGRGACYNYTVPPPPKVAKGERGGVFYLPQGQGRAFLNWPLRGWATPDDDLFPWRGYTVAFPPVDTSIAIVQVMAGTSWEAAGAALDLLWPTVGPPGSRVAITTGVDSIYHPMDVVRTTTGNAVLRGVFNPYPDGANPAFAGWHPLDGEMRSVATAANADGRVELFGINRTGAIFHRWQQTAGDDSTWSPWAQMDGQLSSITAARNQDGTLRVVGTNPAGNVWTRSQILGGDQTPPARPAHPVPAIDSWTPWQQLDGSLSQAAAVTDPDGRVQLFGVNGGGRLFHRQQSDGAWTAWDELSTPGNLRSLAVSTDLGGRAQIIGVDDADRVFQRVKLGTGTSYTAWFGIPGNVHDIAVTKQGGGAGQLVLVGADTAGNVYRNTSSGGLSNTPAGWTPDPWRGWTALPLGLGGDPVGLSPGNQQTVLGSNASVTLSATGGTAPYTWSVSGLPPGLTSQGGTISGSPTTAGSFPVSAVATDVTGERSGPVSFTWTVAVITVPDVTGLLVSTATGRLRAAGLGQPTQHNVVDANCNEPVGTVIGQVPAAGTTEPAGFVVHLEVETWPTGHQVCN